MDQIVQGGAIFGEGVDAGGEGGGVETAFFDKLKEHPVGVRAATVEVLNLPAVAAEDVQFAEPQRGGVHHGNGPGAQDGPG